MSRRGSYGTMADRLAATRDAQAHRDAQNPHGTGDVTRDVTQGVTKDVTRAAPATGEELVDRPRPHQVRHVWVTTEEGRIAGLLIEWRHDSTGWRGRCVYPHGHLVVEDWVPAAQLEPT